MIFVKLPGTTIEVCTTLVKQGDMGFAPHALTRTNISAVDAESYAASRGYRLITIDEWNMLFNANIPGVSIGDMFEWTSTAVGMKRIYRGGGWCLESNSARTANYGVKTPDSGGVTIGFRLVRDIK